MATYECSSAEALKRLKTSPGARWSSGWEVEPEEGTAWQRITADDFFTPVIQPEFTIEREDSVFAIGSCFARTVERNLARLGVEVESLSDAFDQFAVTWDEAWPIGFSNKYNPPAILNELRWALEPGEQFSPEALQQLPDGMWVDPQAFYSIFGSADFETALHRHKLLTELMGRIASCRVVIITLGLIEAFFDNKLGLYTNFTPHLSHEPDRFTFRVLGYDEVVEALEEIHTLLARHGHRDLQLVVTVSPVPLDATFTGEDIVVANTLGKSTLRAAAGWWARAHDNVHYFPGYEMVMNSEAERAWFVDGRHVRPKLVQHIMETFLRTHVATKVPA